MFFPEDEKDERLGALEKLKNVMRSEAGNRLGNKFKKPAAANGGEVPSEREEDSEENREERDDPMQDGDNDEGTESADGDLSDEDKDRIRELYHKFC